MMMMTERWTMKGFVIIIDIPGGSQELIVESVPNLR